MKYVKKSGLYLTPIPMGRVRKNNTGRRLSSYSTRELKNLIIIVTS